MRVFRRHPKTIAKIGMYIFGAILLCGIGIGFGGLGALVPEGPPGFPVYDTLPLALPIAKCGLVTVAIFPALVAPVVACSCTLLFKRSLIFIQLFILISYIQ